MSCLIRHTRHAGYYDQMCVHIYLNSTTQQSREVGIHCLHTSLSFLKLGNSHFPGSFRSPSACFFSVHLPWEQRDDKRRSLENRQVERGLGAGGTMTVTTGTLGVREMLNLLQSQILVGSQEVKPRASMLVSPTEPWSGFHSPTSGNWGQDESSSFGMKKFPKSFLEPSFSVRIHGAKKGKLRGHCGSDRDREKGTPQRKQNKRRSGGTRGH